MATVTAPVNFESYIKTLAQSSPDTALQIAIAETERQKAIAATAAEEYRAMAEIEFDDKGRIVKASMGGLWRLAQMYAGSDMVPEHYRKKPHDCFIACQMAMRLKVDPFAYMQASYVVHGKPGVEAKLAVAILNTSGKIKGRIQYKVEGAGDDKKCTAFATDAETGEVVEADVDWAMVKAEGWLGKNGSKWKTMPDVMFRYRSAIFLIRGYYPEVLMGMQLVDELEDIAPNNGIVPGVAPRSLEDMTAMLNQSSFEAPESKGQPTVEPAAVVAPVAESKKPEPAKEEPKQSPADEWEQFTKEVAACTIIGEVKALRKKYETAFPDKIDDFLFECKEAENKIHASRKATDKKPKDELFEKSPTAHSEGE